MGSNLMRCLSKKIYTYFVCLIFLYVRSLHEIIAKQMHLNKELTDGELEAVYI
jgi:hypothetical protein